MGLSDPVLSLKRENFCQVDSLEEHPKLSIKTALFGGSGSQGWGRGQQMRLSCVFPQLWVS